jgi:glycosyltransferase involved in cell wall biosynthesis
MIAILLPNLRGGGAERISIDLARTLRNKGQSVEFVLMECNGEFLQEALRDFSVHSLNVSRQRSAVLPLARYMRAHRDTAIIANMWPLTSTAVMAKLISRHVGKLLLVEHANLSRQYASWGAAHHLFMRASMMATYRWADRVAAVSRGAAEDTASLSCIPSGRVSVLHNPIPMRAPPAHELRDQADAFWSSPRGRRLLSVGSLKEQKNHALLIRSMALLNDPETTLVIVGDGEKRRELEALASDLGVSSRVHFAGFQIDPSPFYATADLFVLSSDYEGLPTVLIEALSFGVPVVSTDCPSGPSEILGAGRWGTLVPVGDAYALSRAIEEALTSPVDREALKSRASDFSPDIAAARYLELLGIS